MSWIRITFTEVLLLSLSWVFTYAQNVGVVESCTNYERAIFEKRVPTSFLSIGAEIEFHTIDECHSSHQLIVGGHPAEGKEFGPMARLGHKSNITNTTNWFCGGTLLNENFVLTAAHCLYTTNGIVNTVRLGELDFDSSTDDADPEDFGVRRRVPYPKYNTTLSYNDIALVELDHKVKFNVYKHPACLPFDSGDTQNEFIATGWGSTQLLGDSPGHLLKVKLINYGNVCYKIIEDGFNSTTQLCIGSSEAKDTCNGDSGGPVLSYHKDYPCMYHVMGITSFGIGCGTPNVPGIYTRVHFYVDWIIQEIAKGTNYGS